MKETKIKSASSLNVNEKLLKKLMFLYPIYILLLSYFMFSITLGNKLSTFIAYFVIFGVSPFLVYVAKWFFKGILQITKLSRKTMVIFLYTISSFAFLFGLLMHYMDKYNLHDK